MGCCSSKRKDDPDAESSLRNSQASPPVKAEAPSQPSSAPSASSHKPHPPPLQLPRSSVSKQTAKTYKSPHIIITTVYEEKDIIKLEMTPRGTIKKSVHFNCPVCLNYYNVILGGKCCKNYLCHQCAKDMLDRDLKGGKGAACPSCQGEPLELVDVDPAASVKVYTDSFAVSRKDRGSAVVKGEEEDDGLEVRDSPLMLDEPDNRV
jgi:transposase-like protein